MNPDYGYGLYYYRDYRGYVLPKIVFTVPVDVRRTGTRTPLARLAQPRAVGKRRHPNQRAVR